MERHLSEADLGPIWQQSPLLGARKLVPKKNIFLWKTNLYLPQKDSYLHQSYPSTVFWKSFVKLNGQKISFFYRF